MIKQLARKYRVHILSVAILTSLFFVHGASAHLYTGERWSTSTLYYWIDTSTVPFHWYSEYKDSVFAWDGIGSWRLIETTDRNSARGWMSRASFNEQNWTTDAPGTTWIDRDGSGKLARVRTYLNSDWVGWVTDGSQFPDVRTVATHELGHWIIFKDDCAVYSYVMCPNYTVKWSLTSHERSEVQAVYP